ncbi:MAG: hypothetical protein MJ227_04710 [Bacilli bacterium]|nr:hypothetical protein [Bacilli bacterium]
MDNLERKNFILEHIKASVIGSSVQKKEIATKEFLNTLKGCNDYHTSSKKISLLRFQSTKYKITPTITPPTTVTIKGIRILLIKGFFSSSDVMLISLPAMLEFLILFLFPNLFAIFVNILTSY